MGGGGRFPSLVPTRELLQSQHILDLLFWP